MIDQFNEYHNAAIEAAKHGNLDLLKPLVIEREGAMITIHTEWIYNQVENTRRWGPPWARCALNVDHTVYEDETTTTIFVTETTITVEGSDATQIAFARAARACFGGLVVMSRDNGRDPLKIKNLAAWQVQAILAQIS